MVIPSGCGQDGRDSSTIENMIPEQLISKVSARGKIAYGERTYLGYPPSEVNPICLNFAQETNEHARVEHRVASCVLDRNGMLELRSSATLYAIAKCVADAPSRVSLAAADSFNLVPLSPIERHRVCAPPGDELLVDNCFDRDYGEAGENVVGPLQLNAGDVGERLCTMTQKVMLIPTHELFA